MRKNCYVYIERWPLVIGHLARVYIQTRLFQLFARHLRLIDSRMREGGRAKGELFIEIIKATFMVGPAIVRCSMYNYLRVQLFEREGHLRK